MTAHALRRRACGTQVKASSVNWREAWEAGLKRANVVVVVGIVAGCLNQVLLHSTGITSWHDESCGLAMSGADCTEDIGGARALVMRY